MCSPAYAKESKAAGRPLAKPEDLRHHMLLNMHDPQGRWPWLTWAAWLESRGVQDFVPQGTLTLDQYDQVLQAALHGQGVALGRLTLAEQYLRDKRLVALFGGAQSVRRAFHAVYSRSAHARPEVQKFVDWLQRELRSEATATA